VISSSVSHVGSTTSTNHPGASWFFDVGDGFALCSVLASELLVFGSPGSHGFDDSFTLLGYLCDISGFRCCLILNTHRERFGSFDYPH
jgi:hypothetical protein